jgi:hypothetical protein
VNGAAIFAAVGEKPQRVARHRNVEAGGTVLVRKKFVQRLGIDDRTGETVIADLAALLDHHDGDFRAGGCGELAQANRSGQRGGSGSDEEYVDVQGIAHCHNPRRFAARRRLPAQAVKRSSAVVTNTRCAAIRASHGRERGDSKVSGCVPRR